MAKCPVYLPGSPWLSSILLFMMPRKPLGMVVCAPVIVPNRLVCAIAAQQQKPPQSSR